MKQSLNEQFRRMQKLAGIITESQGQKKKKSMFTIGRDTAEMYDFDKEELKKKMKAEAGQYKEKVDYSYVTGYGDDFPNAIEVTNSAMLDDKKIVEFLEGLEGDGEY